MEQFSIGIERQMSGKHGKQLIYISDPQKSAKL
jgi:hypothetical protein